MVMLHEHRGLIRSVCLAAAALGRLRALPLRPQPQHGRQPQQYVQDPQVHGQRRHPHHEGQLAAPSKPESTLLFSDTSIPRMVHCSLLIQEQEGVLAKHKVRQEMASTRQAHKEALPLKLLCEQRERLHAPIKAPMYAGRGGASE